MSLEPAPPQQRPHRFQVTQRIGGQEQTDLQFLKAGKCLKVQRGNLGIAAVFQAGGGRWKGGKRAV